MRRGHIRANKFTLKYGTIVLAQVGPIIPANWAIPNALADQLKKQGNPLPPPVSGQILLDTGASRTCISQEAADQLGLIPTGTTHTYGAGGLTINSVVFAQLLIGIEHSSSRRKENRVITWEQPVQAVPDMEKHAAHWGVTVSGQPARLIGLLGRDILSKATVNYNGVEGKLTVNFDRAWLAELEDKVR